MGRPTFNPRSSIHGNSIMAASINSSQIGPNVVVAADIAAGAVISPKLGAEAIGPTAIASSAVIGAKIKSQAVGLTQAALGIRRNLEVVGLGKVTGYTGYAYTFPVFVAPASGATILSAAVLLGTLMGHAVTSTKAWTFNISNVSKNVCLSKFGATLSGVTLKATSFRTIPLNGGNSTLTANTVLNLRVTASGTPDPIARLTCVLTWTPLNNV